MGTRIYLSDTGTAGSWDLMDIAARCGQDSLRVWLVRRLNLCILGPLPASDVPKHPWPINCQWSAISERTTNQQDP